MSYKTIIVYLPEPDRARVLLDVAMAIADAHEAHLIGLHVIPDIRLYGSVAVELAGEVLEHQRAAMRRDANEVGAIFADATRTMASRVEWRSDNNAYPNLSSEVAREAHCADLIVMGQANHDPYGISDDMPARVIFGSGRPVLIVPSAGSYREVGKNVLLAWNGTREAARAAFDALPLMKRAASVRVLSVNPSKSGDKGALAAGDNLAVALARHGIRTEAATSVTSDISPGDELLSRAADLGADLLVMGCYGHSRLRETIFGGVTRHILKTMTLPVLMSH